MKELIFTLFILVSIFNFHCKNSGAVLSDQPVSYDMIDINDSNMKTVIKRDSLGNKLIEGNVINGKKNGSWITYAPGGQIIDMVNYIEDIKQGPYIKINGGNSFTETGTYRNGKYDGQMIKYLYGHVDEKIEFKDGIRNGWARKYYMGGGLQYEMEIVDSIQNGIYRFYGENGKLQIEEQYKNGIKISGGIVTNPQ